MASTSSCTIDTKLESMSQNYLQSRYWTNKFWCTQWREKLLLTLRTQIEEISTNKFISSDVANKMCRSIQTTQETTWKYG